MINHLKTAAGYALCTLGSPTLLGVVVTCVCAGGGPKTKTDHLALACLIPFIPLALATAPIFLAGVALLESPDNAQES